MGSDRCAGVGRRHGAGRDVNDGDGRPAARDNFVVPALGDNYGPYVPVTTPEEAWPITGLADYTLDTSIRIGLRELEREMANYPDQPLLIFGY